MCALRVPRAQGIQALYAGNLVTEEYEDKHV